MNNATEVNVEWKDDSGDTRTQSETFLTNAASTYGKSESHNRSKPVNVRLRNTLNVNGPIHIYSQLNLSYAHNHYDSEGWSLSAADGLYSDSINSSRYRSRSRSEGITAYGWADVSKRLPSGDSFSLSLNGNFSRQYSPSAESENHCQGHYHCQKLFHTFSPFKIGFIFTATRLWGTVS